ncbi:sulfur carrier protein ThiS [Labilibacter marinus]|uniref:sulfur carrier protein ThiS n=1 Tax=Labilibacter marinus TaxID=1477105 RepID=UPI00082D50E4|nr:sulfur carrier protein ThiS [Labilibacter marinus]
MVIFINDEKKIVEQDIVVATLLEELKLTNSPGMALAVNNQIVLQQNRATTILKENDKVLIISAAKGG